MFAQDLNPIVLGILGLGGLIAFVTALRRSLAFEDTTVEAVDIAPEDIDLAELQALLNHGDKANEILHTLRDLAIEHFEADPGIDAIAPDKVFHLGNTDNTRAQFQSFVVEFEGFLALTRKYKLALDQKTQRAIQKIYFAWDPGGNAMQVKTGNRIWTKDVRPKIEELVASRG